MVPVETLAECQTAEELIRLVAKPTHAGAVEQVLAPGDRGPHQHQEEGQGHHQRCCHLDNVII